MMTVPILAPVDICAEESIWNASSSCQSSIRSRSPVKKREKPGERTKPEATMFKMTSINPRFPLCLGSDFERLASSSGSILFLT